MIMSNQTLNKTEQTKTDEIASKILEKVGENKVDVDALAEKIKSQLQKSDKEIQTLIDQKVNEALDNAKKESNPFTQIQNSSIKVKDTKHYPYGALAIASVVAKRNNTTVESILAERLKANPTSDADKVAAIALYKSYEATKDLAALNKVKSLGIDSITSGAGFSDVSADSEYIELLRARTVVRNAGARTKRLIGGTAKINRGQTSGTAYYLNGGSAITASQPSYDQVTLTAKKLGALVAIDNDAIRFDIHGMAAEVENDIIQTISVKEDEAFLNGSGAAGEPKGLVNWAGNSFTRATTPTAAKAGQDLIKAQRELNSDNIPMVRPVWIMHPSIKGVLAAQTTSTGADVFYAKTLKESNSILNYPVFTTTQLASTNVLLVDMDQVVIGDGYDLTIDVDSSYGFNTDSTYIRGVLTHDLAVRHAEGICKITGVDWDTAL